MNSHGTQIENGYIAINDGKIIELGENDKINPQYRPRKKIDAKGRFIIPGLINSHTHGADVLFRGLVEDLPLEKWLQKLWKVENQFVTGETVYWGSLLSYIEMVKGGITTATDMFFYVESMIRAAKILGFRLITGPVFLESRDHDEFKIKEELSKAKEFLDNNKNSSLLRLCLQPHSIYTVSPNFLRRIGELAKENDCLLAIHASETKNEVKYSIDHYNCSPIQHLDDLGLLSNKTILAHCVHLIDDDYKILAKRDSIVSHCPISNLKLGSGIANIQKMIEANISVTLGTDGPVCCNDLNPWFTLRLAAMLQKTLGENTAILPANEVLQLMTSEAAKSLSLSDKIGSLEVGKLADILIIDNSQAHALPMYDPYSSLIYSIGREDVYSVFINGQLIMDERRILVLDENLVKKEINNIEEKIKMSV